MENKITKFITDSEEININIDSNKSYNFLYIIDGQKDINYNINLNLSDQSKVLFNILTFSSNNSVININFVSTSFCNNINIEINNYCFGFENSITNIKLKSSVLNNAKNNFISQNIIGYLMSSDSTIKGEPILEIQTENVIAKHTLKIGAIDNNELFYLQTKGFSKIEAKKLLIQCFLNKILESFPEFNSLIDNIIKERF